MTLALVPRTLRSAGAALAGALLLAACGGGGDPLGNPPTVQNPPGATGSTLSFAYFQRCIQPILVSQLPVLQAGATGTNSCAGSGCHASATGTGGALRIVPGAALVDLADPANTPAVIRATDMYRNYYSAQGVTVPGDPTQSRLFAKPLLLNVLHGGGRIFASADDPDMKLIAYWINHPVPAGQDEFSPATYAMFTPADPATGTCNTQ